MKPPLKSSSSIFIGYSVVLVLVALSIISVNSCNTKDDCTITCVFGTCVNNVCNCNAGYEGDSCTVLTTAKYVANWNAVDTCSARVWSYVATIASSSVIANQFIITNFGHFGSSFTVYADVSGTSFTIPTQNKMGVTVSGSGTIDVIDSNIAYIYIDYSVEDEFHNTDHCSGEWIKAQ